MGKKEHKHDKKERRHGSSKSAAATPAAATLKSPTRGAVKKQKQHRDRSAKRAVRIEVAAPGADAAAAPFLASYTNGDPDSGAPACWRFELQQRRGGSAPSATARPPRAVCHQGGGGADLIVDPVAEAVADAAPPPATYCLAVYHPSRGMLRVLPVQGGRECRMAVRVAGVDYAPRAHAEDAQRALDADPAALRAQAKRLVEAFGSTRRKRQLKSRDDGRVEAGKLLNAGDVQTALDGVNAAALAAGATRDAVLARSSGYRNIPPHHADATVPHRAYVFSELLPRGLAADALNSGQLLAAAERADAAERLRARRSVPEYVLNRLSLLKAEDDAGRRRSKARVLALLAAMLQLLSGPPTLRPRAPRERDAAAEDGEGGGGEANGDAAAPLRTPLEQLARSTRVGRSDVLVPLLDTFYHHGTEEDGSEVYRRDAGQKELLTGYALVLALDAEGWRLAPEQFDSLRAELKMPAQDVATRFRQLGAYTVSSKMKELGPEAKSYLVTLLQQAPAAGEDAKTLASCFPKPSLKRTAAR